MSIDFIETNKNGKNIKVSSTVSASTWRADTNLRESRSCSVAYVDGIQVVISDDSYCYDDGVWVNAHTSIIIARTNEVLYRGGYLAMDSLIDELAGG